MLPARSTSCCLCLAVDCLHIFVKCLDKSNFKVKFLFSMFFFCCLFCYTSFFTEVTVSALWQPRSGSLPHTHAFKNCMRTSARTLVYCFLMNSLCFSQQGFTVDVYSHPPGLSLCVVSTHTHGLKSHTVSYVCLGSQEHPKTFSFAKIWLVYFMLLLFLQSIDYLV